MDARRLVVRALTFFAPVTVLCLAIVASTPAAAQDTSPNGSQAAATWVGAPVEMTGGIYHMCARSSDGSVLCWGTNYYGQLGDGTGRDRAVPVMTRYLNSYALDVDAGQQHTCAVTTSGQVMCWGLNYWGQVGDGSRTDRLAPVGVAGLTSGYKQVAAGRLFSCALSEGGAVKCWGDNERYQLGDGTTISRTTPVSVSGLGSGVKAIAAGDDHACALTTTGAVKCWGTLYMLYRDYPSAPDYHVATWSSPTPVIISGLPSDITAIAAGGSNACAITSGGALKCWGDNYQGQLGIGTIADVTTLAPHDVLGLNTGTQAVDIYAYNVCAIVTGGAVRCWGFGSFGGGMEGLRMAPTEIPEMSSGATRIGAGSVSCAVITGGSLKCWGGSTTGSMGNGEWVVWSLTPLYVLWPGTTYTFAVSGRVLADGVPHAGATVTAGYQAVKTDANGTYTLTSMAAGAYKVSVAEVGYSFEPRALIVTGPPSRSGVDFAAHSLVPPPPPTPAQPPLLIVHGIQTFAWPGKRCSEGVVHLRTALNQGADYASITTLGELPRWFLDGYDVWMAHLTSSAAGTPPIYDNASCLAAQIDQVYAQTGKKITIVAHSMGGIVTRACLARPECRSKVSTVYTLGTPHGGINWGFAAKVLLRVAEGVARANGVPAPIVAAVCSWQAGFCDLGSDSMTAFFNSNPANRNQPGIRYGFIGGDKTPGAGGGFLWLFDGKNDGAVGRASAVGWVHPFNRPLPSNWMAPSPPVQYWTTEVHNGMFEADGYPYESPRGGGTGYGFGCIAFLEGRRGAQRPEYCRPLTQVAAAADEPTAPPQTTPVFDGILHAGETITHVLLIDDPGPSRVLVAWNTGALDIRLLQPDGQEITPRYAEGDPERMAFMADLSNEGINLASYNFTTTVPGEWVVWLRGAEVGADGTAYSIVASTSSQRQLVIGVDKLRYAPADVMVITAAVTSGINGIAGASIIANLTSPAGVTTTLSMTDLGNGQYQANYIVPEQGGLGTVTVIAHGDDAGTSFERQADLLFAVSSLSAAFGDGHSDRGIDENGDGIYEALAVDVVVDVSTPATFTVAAELQGGGAQLGATAAVLVAAAPGAQTVRLLFDGSELAKACFTVPYTVANAYLVDHAAGVTPSDVKAVLYITNPYNCSQFGGHAVYAPLISR